MKLFTHQSKEFVNSLLRDGFIKNNGSVMRDEKHIKYAYERLVKYARYNVSDEFVGFPIWCWYKIETAYENDGIKIELDVPDELALLTDYYDWGGGVLYYAELYLNGINEIEGETLTAKESMERDFSNCVNQNMLREDIQAIIPYIKLEWVTNVEELKESVI
mgnify:CR=1 FL=1